MVFPAVRAALAGCRRDGPVRSQLVQPSGRGTGHGILPERRRTGILPYLPRVRADADSLGDYSDQVLVFGRRRGAGATVSRAHSGSDEAVETQPHGSGVTSAL